MWGGCGFDAVGRRVHCLGVICRGALFVEIEAIELLVLNGKKAFGRGNGYGGEGAWIWDGGKATRRCGEGRWGEEK